MAHTTVDTRHEKFGSKITIAHLASNGFTDLDSNQLHIYQVADMLTRDWRDEIAEPVEMEYLTGVTAMFADGSKLSIGAWADCCDDKRCKHCLG